MADEGDAETNGGTVEMFIGDAPILDAAGSFFISAEPVGTYRGSIADAREQVAARR